MAGGAPAAAPREATRALRICAFGSIASMRVCDSLTGPLALDFGADVVAAARSISLFAIAYGLLQLFYGPLSERIGKTRVIAWAVAGSALVNLALALSPSLSFLVGARVVAGALAAGIVPIAMAYIGDTVPFAERQPALASFLTATLTGMIAGQWLSGVLGDYVHWRASFIALALVFGYAAWRMHRLGLFADRREVAGASDGPPGSMQPAASFAAQVRGVVSQRWSQIVLLVTFIEGMLALSVFALVPTHLNRHFGISMSSAGAMLALFGCGGLVYALTARKLLARLGEDGLALGGGLSMGTAYVLLACDLSPWLAAPASLLGGLGLYMLHNTLQTHATQLSNRYRGTAVALFASALFLGQSIGVSAAAAAVGADQAQWLFTGCALATPLLAWSFAQALKRRNAVVARSQQKS